MRRFLAVVLPVFAACSQAPTSAPKSTPGVVPLGTFTGVVDAAAGTVSVSSDSSPSPTVSRSSVAVVTGISVTGGTVASVPNLCTGPAAITQEVTASASAFGINAQFYDVFAQITTISNPLAFVGCKVMDASLSFPAPYPANDLGLWYYPSLLKSDGSPGAMETWAFDPSTGTRSTFRGEFWGSVANLSNPDLGTIGPGGTSRYAYSAPVFNGTNFVYSSRNGATRVLAFMKPDDGSWVADASLSDSSHDLTQFVQAVDKASLTPSDVAWYINANGDLGYVVFDGATGISAQGIVHVQTADRIPVAVAPIGVGYLGGPPTASGAWVLMQPTGPTINPVVAFYSVADISVSTAPVFTAYREWEATRTLFSLAADAGDEYLFVTWEKDGEHGREQGMDACDRFTSCVWWSFGDTLDGGPCINSSALYSPLYGRGIYVGGNGTTPSICYVDVFTNVQTVIPSPMNDVINGFATSPMAPHGLWVGYPGNFGRISNPDLGTNNSWVNGLAVFRALVGSHDLTGMVFGVDGGGHQVLLGTTNDPATVMRVKFP